MRKKQKQSRQITEKANNILNGIFIIILLILFRLWCVAVFKHEEKIEESHKPQQRIVLQRAPRATFSDRFFNKLAANRAQYNVYVCYEPIRDLPRWIWKKDLNGKKTKYFFRTEYIKALSQKLQEEISVKSDRVEDIIHSKAAILGNVPCIIKEDLSESEYFRLKMLEREWPGIHAEMVAKRYYPAGPVGSEIVGYIGPISSGQYKAINDKLKCLRECIAMFEDGEEIDMPPGCHSIEEVKKNLYALEKQAYRLNDYVGKLGVEYSFDTKLRGLSGKQIYLVDTRGRFVRSLPGSEPPTPGKHLVLTISSELQAYAERLLTEYNQMPLTNRKAAENMLLSIPENRPWIKGGAIVVMDPSSGEIYALASYPRFNPNDFLQREKNMDHVYQLLESDGLIERIWDSKQNLTRERYGSFSHKFYEEEIQLNWDNYLRFILPPSSLIRATLQNKNRIHDALCVQNNVEQLLQLFRSDSCNPSPGKIFDAIYCEQNHVPTGEIMTLQEKKFFEERKILVQKEVDEICSKLNHYFHDLPLNYDKLLLTDLYKVGVDNRKFDTPLANYVGSISLSEYRSLSMSFMSARDVVLHVAQNIFHEETFQPWREKNFKSFLDKKRKEELKKEKKSSRPYLEYLDEAEKEMFNLFWTQNQEDLISAFLTEEAEQNEPLKNYIIPLTTLAKESYHLDYQDLKSLKKSLKNKKLFFSFLQSFRSFSQLDRALLHHYVGVCGTLEKNLASAFYPTYGFGFARSYAFRQAATIGSIFKLVTAYEALRQRYIKNFIDLNPLTIIDNKQRVYGKSGEWVVGTTLDGKSIPSYYRGGRLPKSEHFEIGRVDLVRALETSSNPYFAILAGDVLNDPEDLCKAALLFNYGKKTNIDLPGEYGGNLPDDIAYNRTGLYAMAIGQHTLTGTPLQTAVMLSALANGGEILQPKVVRSEKNVRERIFLPKEIQSLLLTGLKQVIVGEDGTARSLQHQFSHDLLSKIVGKTSTAEFVETFSLDSSVGKLKSKSVWFGAISYSGKNFSKPELVVVVYLKYGDFGRDAAPLVIKMIQKWHEILAKNS